jgi:AraC family transcriptional regulator of arabinose operon
LVRHRAHDGDADTSNVKLAIKEKQGLDCMEYFAIVEEVKIELCPPRQSDPRYDPAAILQHEYANLTVGHFRRMKDDYRIVRLAGTHDWLIILGVSGGGLIRRGEKTISLRPRQLVLFKPGMSQDYGTDPKIGHWGLIWAHFHAPTYWIPLLNWAEPVPGILILDLSRRTVAARRVLEAFHEMYRLATSTFPRRDWLAMNALEGLLLRCDALISRTRKNLDSRVEAVTEYIQQHLSEPLSLHGLSKLVHLSISQLSALFRQHLKSSPYLYIENRRMDQARRLLQFHSLSIKEVAGRSGFQDALYFSKRFRHYFGFTPSYYRNQIQCAKLQDFPCRQAKHP